MQTRRRPATLAAMRCAQAELTRAVTVHLAQSPGAIRGRLANEDGTVTPFDGWLELAAAIERARDKGGGDEREKQSHDTT